MSFYMTPGTDEGRDLNLVIYIQDEVKVVGLARENGFTVHGFLIASRPSYAAVIYPYVVLCLCQRYLNINMELKIPDK